MSHLNVNISEQVVKGLIRGGVHPVDLFIGLRNSLCHGDLFEEGDLADLAADYGEGDIRLDSLITKLDLCIKDLRDMGLH